MPEKTDKDRLIEVRDLLREQWDRLNDPKNGFGVHSSYYGRDAKEKALKVGGDLATAELAVIMYDQPE